MMYNNKLVASIKTNGKILREFKDSVYIPFGVEYSILLKNLNTVKALVNVYIDGENVVPGGLVLNAGQEIDLERSIKNGNMNAGNKFKFIERTSKIEDHRGIKVEDGLIRVEFQFEKVFQRQDGIQFPNTIMQPTWTVNNSLQTTYYDHTNTMLRGMAAPTYNVGSMVVGSSACSATVNNISASSATLSASQSKPVSAPTKGMTKGISHNAAPQSETGITVAGSKSEQKFTTASWFATEPEKHSIILKILGETLDNKAIREPVTVKAKPKCPTCGKQNKATAKFCNECGTALEIFA